jgi:hypothetical protein
MIKISNHTTICSLFRGSISFVVNDNFTLYIIYVVPHFHMIISFLKIWHSKNSKCINGNFKLHFKKLMNVFLIVNYNFLSLECSWLSTSLYEENQGAFYKMNMFMLQHKHMLKLKHTWVLHWTSMYLNST